LRNTSSWQGTGPMFTSTLARFVHTEPMKFPLRRNQRIASRFTALNINADLTGRF
jgi:hypothetical protein